jgi:hypothetical protein
MIKRTISGMIGAGSLAHNRRDFVAENVNLYLDLSKTTEAMVDTNWQANLGFRWEL